LVNNVTISNLDTPEYALPDANRIPVNDYPSHMAPIPPSRMFTIKEALKKFKAKTGGDTPAYDASQGDGGASLPGVPKELLLRAAEMQVEHGTGYDKPFGTREYQVATAEQYWGIKPETGWGPDNVIFCQGGRDALPKAFSAMIAQGHGRIGDLIVTSRVPWISYNWSPYGAGLNVLRAPGRPEDSWRYTPEGIQASVDFAAQDGRKIAGILITSPDNPTGRTVPLDEQIALGKTALAAGVPFVLYDWIYHWITDGSPYDINTVLEAFSPDEREKLIFLDGLTKSLGASNIRSAHLVANTKVVKFISSNASHAVIPSYYGQAVAMAAYEIGFGNAIAGTNGPTSQSRKILRAALEAEGVDFVMGDGYYAFIDVSRYLEAKGWADSAPFGEYLAEEHGIAVVPGVFFSAAGGQWVRFSYAQTPEVSEKAIARFFEGAKTLL
jgi:aspartate aminotransferase